MNRILGSVYQCSLKIPVKERVCRLLSIVIDLKSCLYTICGKGCSDYVGAMSPIID
jgi:hypothetical protein